MRCRFGSKMITLSDKTDTTFSDIPILMIGDNCLVHSPQLLLFKMYVLFLLESPSWSYSMQSASQLVVCCQVKLVKSWSRWSNWSKVGQVGEKNLKLLVTSWWKVGETLVKRWSKVGQALLKKCFRLGKLVTSWSWWKVGEKLVNFVKSWWICEKLVDLVKIMKNWWSWWIWPGAGQVGEKLVKSWWKVGEVREKLVNLVKSWWIWWSWWKVGDKLVKFL